MPQTHKNSPSIEQIEEDLGFFDDWEERYRYLIDLGKGLPEMPASEKTPANIVHGCTSQVWLTARSHSSKSGSGSNEGGTNSLELRMDSDALIVRGLLGLVAATYNGKSVTEIRTYDINGLFERLDLLSHLSMTRGNGLRAMVGRIQTLAGELAD